MHIDPIAEYQDILQNIEMQIVTVFRNHRKELLDDDVKDALNAVVKKYSLEGKSIPLRLPRLDPLEQEIYDVEDTLAEWLLGRRPLLTPDDKEVPAPEPVTPDVIIACFKRIIKSIDTWTKQGGPQGYLKYIDQFLP